MIFAGYALFQNLGPGYGAQGEKLVVVKLPIGKSERAGGKQVDRLVGTAGRWVDIAERHPRRGRRARLLSQFAHGAVERRFARFKTARGNFQKRAAHGVAVLLDHEDFVRVRERDNPHSARMLHDFARTAPPVRKHDGIPS